MRARVAFLNAAPHPLLRSLNPDLLFLQQHFRPLFENLNASGFRVSPEPEEAEGVFDAVLVRCPKALAEARYFMARALEMLKEGGVILCAADNKAGGTRLKKMLQDFGISAVQEISKNKARAVWGQKENADAAILRAALVEGSLQPVAGGDFLSMPGIFGWDQIDRGSEILATHLPHTFAGTGADFGCGYGYLSAQVLRHNPGVRKFFCVDADYRALRACAENLKGFEIEYLWRDLSKPMAEIKALDFIVMNPPFHRDKETDFSLGQSFVNTALLSLKEGGDLWMVANRHLPYETVLKRHFKTGGTVFEGEGFKIIHAVK